MNLHVNLKYKHCTGSLEPLPDILPTIDGDAECEADVEDNGITTLSDTEEVNEKKEETVSPDDGLPLSGDVNETNENGDVLEFTITL